MTDIGEKGDYNALNFNTNELSQDDILELDKEMQFEMQNQFNNTTIGLMKLLEWYPLKIEIINGMSCMHINYKRQLNNNKPVIVHLYNFQNYDRSHTLTLSYRKDEEIYWKSDFEIILNSLRINKIN